MDFFVSDSSIEKAYNELVSLKVDNTSMLQIFLILKACGYDSIKQKSVSIINELGLEPAWHLCGLFSSGEKAPVKYEFISPFSMEQWAAQAPSEPLKKWVTARIKNNVIGGATTWRLIIDDNQKNKEFKFTYNYLEELKKLTLRSGKINSLAIAIWVSRFIQFPRKLTARELISYFYKKFNITKEEISELFEIRKVDFLQYQSKPHDSQKIRALIGAPKALNDKWIESNFEQASHNNLKKFTEIDQKMITTTGTLELAKIKELLNKEHQLILAGPPGTSKSYTANLIAKKYKAENVIKIQFHPKYSYQDFIGGYVVNAQDVSFQRGVLVKFAKVASNSSEDFLLIIDEINRANVGQVFGETIQCLDRGYTTQVLLDGKLELLKLPSNLKIIGTMNSADRTLGTIDFAIKRRFTTIYFPSEPESLIDLCDTDFGISCCDLLREINKKLISTLKNRDLTVGHAIFMQEYALKGDKYVWNLNDFELLFNYKILPIIEDYTRGNDSQLVSILGTSLPTRLIGEAFKEALSEFLL